MKKTLLLAAFATTAFFSCKNKTAKPFIADDIYQQIKRAGGHTENYFILVSWPENPQDTQVVTVNGQAKDKTLFSLDFVDLDGDGSYSANELRSMKRENTLEYFQEFGWNKVKWTKNSEKTFFWKSCTDLLEIPTIDGRDSTKTTQMPFDDHNYESATNMTIETFLAEPWPKKNKTHIVLN